MPLFDSMYVFEPHIVSLYSSAALAWLLLALLSCIVITRIAYPPFLHDCLTVVFSKITRRYSDTTRLTPVVFSHLFLLGTLSLCLWLCLYTAGPLRWLHYGLIAGLISAWLLLRFLITRFLGYVFSIRHEAQAVQEDSLSLLMLVSLLFYAVCCVAPLMPVQKVLPMIAAGIIALYLIVLTGKMLVTYARSLKMLFYIVLYILTLEIIPLTMLYGVASQLCLIV